MRIAYVVTRADAVGGASIHVRDLAAAMSARGHEVLVLVGGTGPVTEQLAAAGVPFRPLAHLRRALHPLSDARALKELAGALAGFRPHLVSTHTAKAGWLGRAVCARLRLPVIYTPHGLPLGDRMPGARGTVFGIAERVAARWTARMICVCEYERRLAVARGGMRPEQIDVVYNGVRDVPEELHARPGAGAVRLVSVARFEAPKDHATLLEALAGLRARDWELELAGEGPLQAGTRELAARLGISERVRFLGYLPDTAPVLARAQVFVLSSRSEAFPRSILEAMRAGLAMVASDVGGVGEAVTHGTDGVLVPRGDPAALAAALDNLLGDTIQRQRLGRAARFTYEARFRLECMIERTAAIYESVLRQNADRRATV